MKKILQLPGSLLLFSLLLLAFGLQAQTAVKGNGTIKTEDREVSNFSKLSVSGGLNVILSTGDKESLKLEGDENLLELIRTEVKNGRLEIATRKSISPSRSMKVYLTVKKLSDINLSGAVVLRSNSKLSGNSLNLTLAGASVFTSEIAVKTLEGTVSGGSNLNLSGSANSATLSGTGSSNINSPDLKTDELKATLSGASQARISVAQNLDATVSGASTLHYKGNPAVTKSITGAASLKQM